MKDLMRMYILLLPLTTQAPLLLIDELIKTEGDIRKKRQQMIYAQEERRRQILEWCAIGLLVIIVVGFF